MTTSAVQVDAEQPPVLIDEPDVSPLQLQGPNSGQIMRALFGEEIMDLKYYWLREVDLDGMPDVFDDLLAGSALGRSVVRIDPSQD